MAIYPDLSDAELDRLFRALADARAATLEAAGLVTKLRRGREAIVQTVDYNPLPAAPLAKPPKTALTMGLVEPYYCRMTRYRAGYDR